MKQAARILIAGKYNRGRIPARRPKEDRAGPQGVGNIRDEVSMLTAAEHESAHTVGAFMLPEQLLPGRSS
jgi:hypothetical protein